MTLKMTEAGERVTNLTLELQFLAFRQARAKLPNRRHQSWMASPFNLFPSFVFPRYRYNELRFHLGPIPPNPQLGNSLNREIRELMVL